MIRPVIEGFLPVLPQHFIQRDFGHRIFLFLKIASDFLQLFRLIRHRRVRRKLLPLYRRRVRYQHQVAFHARLVPAKSAYGVQIFPDIFRKLRRLLQKLSLAQIDIPGFIFSEQTIRCRLQPDPLSAENKLIRLIFFKVPHKTAVCQIRPAKDRLLLQHPVLCIGKCRILVKIIGCGKPGQQYCKAQSQQLIHTSSVSHTQAPLKPEIQKRIVGIPDKIGHRQ